MTVLLWIATVGITIGGLVWMVLNRVNRPLLAFEEEDIGEAYIDEPNEDWSAFRGTQHSDAVDAKFRNRENWPIACGVFGFGVFSLACLTAWSILF